MRVFITGGTGLIGRHLAARLLTRQDTPVVLTRSASKASKLPELKGAEIVPGDPAVPGDWQKAVDGCDAVIHLAGQNVFGPRWNKEIKRQVRDSRVLGTRHVVEAITSASRRPKVLLQGSAIGYYGARGDEELTESGPPGDDFMARLCVDWEAAARPVEALGVRLPILRTGVVLAQGEGPSASWPHCSGSVPVCPWVAGARRCRRPAGSG